MRMMESCLMLSILVPNVSNAETDLVPEKIKTGAATLGLTREERFRQNMQLIAAMGPEPVQRLETQARLAHMRELNEIMPQWAHEVPIAILFHVDFNLEDTPLRRAQKFLRTALLIRDMYDETLPLNVRLHTLETPQAQRISDAKRHELVARAFAAAAEIVAGIKPGFSHYEQADLWLSLSQLEYWASHHYGLAEQETQRDTLKLALRAFDDAGEAQKAMQEPNAEWDSRINSIRASVSKYVAQLLAPALWLAFQRASHTMPAKV